MTLYTTYDEYWVGEASELIHQPGLPVPTTPAPKVVSLSCDVLPCVLTFAVIFLLRQVYKLEDYHILISVKSV